MVDVDLALLAIEAEGEPALALAAILALPHIADEMRRQLIRQPAAALGDDAPFGRTDLLEEFAPGRGARPLACVDAALRHLPGTRCIDTLGDEYLAGAIDQHDADAAAIGQGFDLG